jgi:hypothetical protein
MTGGLGPQNTGSGNISVDENIQQGSENPVENDAIFELKEIVDSIANVSIYFIIEIDTTQFGVSNNNQFEFTGAVGNYDVEAYQSGSQVASFAGLIDEQTITLPSAGIYELRIIPKPNFDKFKFDDGGDKEKLTQIIQWGLYGVNEPNQNRAFDGCNLDQIPGDGAWFKFVADAFVMFRNNNLTTLPADMTMPNLNDGAEMFRENSLITLSIEMQLPKLTQGDFMFSNNKLTSLPPGMNLNNLFSGVQMFKENNLSELPKDMDLPKLQSGFGMFNDNLLTSLPQGMKLPVLNDGTTMFINNTINTTRYSDLLIDMEANNPNNNVQFDGGNSQYNGQGQTARNALIARGWTITDGGLAEEFYFNIEVDTTQSGVSNNDQFQFTGAIGNYDVEAYQQETQVATYSNLVNEQTITLPASGVYELRVIPKPNFDKLVFDNGGDKDKLLQILQWGLYGVNEPDQERAFFGCNLTQIPDGGAWFDVVTNGINMFRNNSLTSLPEGMELPNLSNGIAMFWDNNLTSLPEGMELPNLSSGNVMFNDNNLTSLPSGMELPLLTNGDSMFSGNNLTSLPSGMELPNLNNAFQMFLSNSLTTLPAGMKLPNLTFGRSMFWNNNLTSLPAGMELPLLTNGFRMFRKNTINTSRYSQLLIDLEAGNSNNNVSFNGGNSQYNAQGQIARNALIARGWTITDGGLEV